MSDKAGGKKSLLAAVFMKCGGPLKSVATLAVLGGV